MNAKRTACHEAAHCLIAWLYGYRITMVTISPIPETVPQNIDGVCRVSAQPDGGTMCEPRNLTPGKVYYLMAGRVADDLFFPDEPYGSAVDFENIILMLPPNNVTLKMLAFDRNKETIEAFYKKFKTPVKNILKSSKGKRALKMLARALLKVGTLSGAEAVSILEKSWGKPLPVLAAPAKDHCGLTEKGPKTYTDLLRSLSIYHEVMLEDIKRLRFELEGTESDRIDRIWSHLLMGKVLLSD